MPGATTAARIRVAHATPGRFRLQISPAHRTPETLAEIQQRLDVTPGVTSTRVKPETGSVVVQHRLDAAFDDILERAGLSEQLLVEALPPRLRTLARSEGSHLAHGVTDWFFDLDARLSRASGGWLDLKMAIPLTLLGTAAWRFAATASEGTAWLEMPPLAVLYYAFDSFVKLHQPSIERNPVPANRVGPRARMLPEQDAAS